MKDDTVVTIATATQIKTKEINAGRASFFNEARFALKRISGIAIGTHTSDKVVAMEVSLKRKLSRKPAA